MIETLKPYSEMRDSGVEWLGEVPAHWEVVPGLRMLKRAFERNIGMKEKQVLSLSYGRIVVKPEEKLRGLVPESFETYQLVDPDDIIVRATDLQNDQTSLRIGHAQHRGIITSAYLRLVAREGVLPRFAFLLLYGYDLLKILYGFGSGLRQNLEEADFKRMPMPLPPIDEQAAIVRFLADADRRIGGLLAAKQRLVGLLEEAKAAIVHRAVTKGLNPAAPTKASGVPWLGDIPAHWEVVPIKHVTVLKRGKFSHRPRNDPEFYDGPYPFIQTGEVARAKKYVENYRQTLNELGKTVSASFPANTLVMAIAANIGDVALLNFEAYCPDSIIGFLPDIDRIDRDFLYYMFRTLKDEFVREAPVNTQGNLNIERVGARQIPIPFKCEQTEIVAHIESETATLDKAIATARAEIDLLREYRTRLIADVVTGKRDVRAAAADLPDIADDAPLPDLIADGSEDMDDETGEMEAA